MDKLLSVVFMVGVLLLVLPGFLKSNSQLKQFLKNLSIWIIVILTILLFIYLNNRLVFYPIRLFNFY
jgi:low affinity Fe/Cu permease